MKYLYNISFFCLLLILFSGCEKDEPKCTIKDKNYAVATFLGETYEPYWNSGSFHPGCRYSLDASIHGNIWYIGYFTESDDFMLQVNTAIIESPGIYPIEEEAYPDTKTFLRLFANGSDGNFYTNFSSVAETGFMEVTEYDAQAGILIGTFYCDMSNGNEIIPISGEFNINLPELEECNKPCWL